MIEEDFLVTTIRDFLLQSILHGRCPETLPADLDLFESGIIDSMAFVELVSYLQEVSGVEIVGHELSPKNFGSITAMVKYVKANLIVDSITDSAPLRVGGAGPPDRSCR